MPKIFFFSRVRCYFFPLHFSRLPFVLSLFLSFSYDLHASFRSLYETDDSIISSVKKASADSYKYMELSKIRLNIQNFVDDDGLNVHLFKGKTGLESVFGYYQHNLGSVSFDRRKNQAIISFHGSKTADDWLSNFKLLSHNVSWGRRGKVHKGFYDIVDSGYQNLVSIIQSNISNHDAGDFEFVFTGHSLGGATSTLAASRFFSEFSSNIFPSVLLKSNQIKVITFSAPCVGDQTFSNWSSEVFHSNLIRFVSNLDPVPSVPMWNEQIGDEIRILFLEKIVGQINSSSSALSDQLNSGGLQPKIDFVKNVSGLVFSFPVELTKSSLAFVAGEALLLSHKIPEIDTLKSAFFEYKLRTFHLPEGSASRDDSQIRKPGEVGFFDTTRNPVMRTILSFFGGY